MNTRSGIMRLLIVHASMGQGHTRVSEELRRQLEERGHEVVVADLNELMPRPAGVFLSRLYPWLVGRTPWLYERIYRTFFLASRQGGGRVLPPILLSMPGLRRLADEWQPDAVVSTFHLAAMAAARLRGKGQLPCPAVTFITTFAVHNVWVHPSADLHLCITQAAADEVTRRSGGPASVCGLVVRPGFTALSSDTSDGSGTTSADAGHADDTGHADNTVGSGRKARLRRKFGLPARESLALVVAGSLGLGQVERAARAVASCPGWSPVVVCGYGDALRRQVEQLGIGTVFGWVDEMAALMASSDVLVENAAGLSAKEALSCGLPVVTFQPIPGHGRDDADSLARLALTDVVDDEQALSAALRRLAGRPRERAERVARGRALAAGDAVAHIEKVAGSCSPVAVDAEAA